MVNLLLTSKAVSNTFDNVMEVDTGGAEKVQPCSNIRKLVSTGVGFTFRSNVLLLLSFLKFLTQIW